MFPACQCKRELVCQDTTIGLTHREPIHRKHISILRMLHIRCRHRTLDLLHVIAKVRETMYDRLELRDGCLRRRIISYDEKGKRVHNLLEGDCGLHEPAKLHLPREDTRYSDHIGKEETDAPMQLGHPCKLDAMQHEAEEIPPHIIESVKSPHHLTLFPAIERDALEMLAQTRKTEAQICLILLLAVAETHDRAPRPERRPCAEESIGDGEPHHIAGQSERLSEKRNVKHPRQPPEHRTKGRNAQSRIEDAERQIQKI